MSTTQILLENIVHGVPSGNYDGSSLDFASDADNGPGYYQGNSGQQTIAIHVSNFNGIVQVQGTIDCLPDSTTNWVTIQEFDLSDSTPANYTQTTTVTGQYTWIRARVLNFVDGTIDSVVSTYAGASVTTGGSDSSIGVFTTVTANAVFVGSGGVDTSGNITGNYILGDGSLLTGIASLDSFSVETQIASGNGALVYNAGNGVFQFTPADAGASDYGNADVAAYLAVGLAGNIIPAANVTYSLGNATNQWANVWVAANTIYIGGVPVGITGNTLTIAGEPVLSNDSDSSITTTGDITAGNVNATDNVVANGIVQGNVITADSAINTAGTIAATGNVTAGNIITDGEVISTGRAYVRYLDIRGGEASGTIGSLGYSGNIPQLHGTAGIQIITGDAEGGPTWQFDTAGNLTAPGHITTTGNIAAGNILTDNYLYANGAPFVSASTGNITFSDTTMSPPDGVDITISAANSEVIIGAFDIRLDATDDLRLTGNDIVSLRNRSTTDSITIRTDYDNNDYVWEFAVNGTLTTPGDIVTAGDVTGTAGASTLYFKAQPDSNTYIQLNNSVDSVISTVANLEIRTDVSNTALVWSFDTTGLLTAPGNITTSRIVTAGYFSGNGSLLTSVAAANVVGTVASARDLVNGTTAVRIPLADGSVVFDVDGFEDIMDVNPEGLTVWGNTANVQGDLVVAGTADITGNVTTGNLIVTESLFGSSGSPQPTISGFSTISATGNITGGNVITTGNVSGNTAGFAIGYRDIPQIAFTGNVTMAAADAGKHFYSTESTDYILTIADNSAVSWPVGTAITVVNRGTGNITVAQASGVSLYLAGNSSAGNRTVTTYGMATVLNVAANVWMINGTGVS